MKGRRIVIVGGVAGGGSAATRWRIPWECSLLDYDVLMSLHRLLSLKRDPTTRLRIVDSPILSEG